MEFEEVIMDNKEIAKDLTVAILKSQKFASFNESEIENYAIFATRLYKEILKELDGKPKGGAVSVKSYA